MYGMRVDPDLERVVGKAEALGDRQPEFLEEGGVAEDALLETGVPAQRVPEQEAHVGIGLVPMVTLADRSVHGLEQRLAGRALAQRAADTVDQAAGLGEQHLLLRGEVPEEGPHRDAGGRGDLFDRDVVDARGRELLERDRLELVADPPAAARPAALRGGFDAVFDPRHHHGRGDCSHRGSLIRRWFGHCRRRRGRRLTARDATRRLPPMAQAAVLGEVAIEARNVSVGYGPIPVVTNLDLVVRHGEVVALLGVNGAGKTTTVRALAGELKPSAGEILFRGKPTTASLHRRARNGLRLITEERSVFMGLSAADNLRLGGQSRARCLELFPELEPVLRRKAALLSGGQQQMLSLARALAADPEVLLADELSLGLAPLVCERLFGAVRAAAANGAGVLLVEQHVRAALEIADRAYVLSRGQVVLEGDASDLASRITEIERTYLAAAELDLGAAG